MHFLKMQGQQMQFSLIKEIINEYIAPVMATETRRCISFVFAILEI